MRRVLGFVAWTGLLTAGLLWVSPGETAELSPGPLPAKTARSRPRPAETARVSETVRRAKTARQLYSTGRELYWQARYGEALAAFEAAATAAGDLSPSDRDRLQEFVQRARAKTGAGEGSKGVVARGQSDDDTGKASETGAGSSKTGEAKKLLGEARRQFNTGKVVEAEKLAQNCKKLGVHWLMFGDNPERLLEEIKEYRKQEAAWKQDNASSDACRNRSNYLLTRARQVLEEGDAGTADRLVREAEQIKVKRSVKDLKPEQLRQQLARLPGAARKPSAVVQADGVQTAQADTRRDIRQVLSDEESLDLPLDTPEIRKAPAAKGQRGVPAAKTGAAAEAEELLNQAEKLMKEGRLDEARAKVLKAQKLDVAYEGALAATPEYLLAMIERAEEQGLLAQAATEKDPGVKNAGAKNPLAKETAAKKTDTKKTAAAKRAAAQQEAVALTQAAEADLEAGRIEDAKAKAGLAREIDVAYDLLDPTPEDVLEKATRAGQDPRYLAQKTPARTGRPPVIGLGLDAGDDEEAPALSANDRAINNRPGNALSAETFSTDNEIARTEAAGESEIEDPAVVSPNGLSALELYQRGRQAIKSGNPELATRYYLQAFQSGEKLDNRKMQEIQEYLAQHRTKKIQLLGTRQVPESEVGPAARDEDGARPIDQVGQQRQIALDKLRTEVRNAEFRAERLAATDPQAALEMIDKAQSSVERSGLEAQVTGSLLKSLAKSRDNIEYNRKLTAPRIAMEKRNAEVKATIKREEETKVRIDQDFAEKVQKYNELLTQKRFDEAIVLAKQARLLQPDSPVAELMVYKAKFAKQEDFNRNNRERKADAFTKQLNDVDDAAAGYVADIEYPELKKWQKLTESRRKYNRADNRIPTPEEQKIQRSLSRDVSLHFDTAPLAEVIKRLASLAEVNIVLDPAGLDEEGVTSNTSVSINVEAIRLRSALNLLLEPLRLGYTIKDDVLKITSHMRQQGELTTRSYSVADLVIPIRDFGPVQGNQGMISSGFNTGIQALPPSAQLGQMSVSSTSGFQKPAGQAFAQVEDRDGSRRMNGNRPGETPVNQGMQGGAGVADFNSLMSLITTTIQPESWEDLSGPGSIMSYRTTLSLVIRQTQSVHDEIADLLGQLRRLQDLQVTVECRFVTVSDNFFERIGIDFNFNLPTNVNNGLQNTFGAAAHRRSGQWARPSSASGPGSRCRRRRSRAL